MVGECCAQSSAEFADAEIDLVVERPGQPILLIEIKSNTQIKQHDLQSFIRLSQDFPNSEAVCFSNDLYAKQIAHITVLPWQTGIKQYFCLKNKK